MAPDPASQADLFETACRSLRNAYAPYTEIAAGVAVRLKDGSVYSGASFENASYMHGVEPLEGALGQALVRCRPFKSGKITQVTEAVYCFETMPRAEGARYPGPLSLMLLRLWAVPEIAVSCITPDGHIFASYDWNSLLTHMPPPAVDSQAFLAKATARANSTVPSGIFTREPMNSLFDARLQAFCPISNYAVGAMVETESGGRFFGCNCEPGGNKAIHAEAVALAAMVNEEGPRAHIRRVTILTGGRPGFPCGGCRQYINEFATEETEIVCMNLAGETITSRHADLLPLSFGRIDLDIR